jgi:hypothetical protein
MRSRAAGADSGGMIVRLVTLLAAVLLLAGCSTEEGRRAQELLQQAEQAQAALVSSTFDGSMSISFGGMDMRVVFEGATSRDGEWISVRTNGAPDGDDMALEVLARGGRGWMKLDGRWQTMPLPTGSGSKPTLSAAAFQELTRYVEAVRVTEHQLVAGKAVTTIAGDIDTEAMVEAFMQLGSLAPEGASLDLSELGLEIGDIHAVLTIDERTRLLDSALITFAMSAEGKSAEIELRYRLSSANEPVSLPSAPN